MSAYDILQLGGEENKTTGAIPIVAPSCKDDFLPSRRLDVVHGYHKTSVNGLVGSA
jgi:hypothetical protein